MASEACDICGEEVDEDDDDPHGHFSSGDEEEEEDEYICHLLISGRRRDMIACDKDTDDLGNASSNESDVNCPECRAVM